VASAVQTSSVCGEGSSAVLAAVESVNDYGVSEKGSGMGIFDRLRGSRPTAAIWPPMVLVPTGLRPVRGERKSLHQRGYWMHDARTDQAISYRELSELVPGAIVFHVAGASRRIDAIQGPVFEPGRPVTLVPEPKNPHDRNAVGVWDWSRRAQAGYVPRELAPDIGQALRRHEPFSSVCHLEFLEDGRRVGLSVLFGPAAFIQSLAVENSEGFEEDG